MTHTPGPWIYSGKGYICGGECCVADTETYSATKKLSPPQRAANARLIAAAPDLLKALTDLMDQLECVGIATKSQDIDWTEMEAEERDTGNWHGTEGFSFNKARKAIAKATGVS